MFEGLEKAFQKHVAQYLIREHGYGMLRQADITDRQHYFAEEKLMAFLEATQGEMLRALVDDYGVDARGEVLRALRKQVRVMPLWMVMRHGLRVRGCWFRLYGPKPRSSESFAHVLYRQNRLYVMGGEHELTIKGGKRPDFVLFLNGLPVVTMELKHEKNQTVHDAVRQYVQRDHSDLIFRLPFVHIAADTSDVMVATDPCREANFRWYNMGLTNRALTQGEYAVEFLYRHVLSMAFVVEALAFFLVYVPAREGQQHQEARAAYTIFPRYHQSRMVNRVAADALQHFGATGDVGKKYLVHHSAGSGKTLSICWLADRLHSLYKPGSNHKMLDMIFVLTDRRLLDKNIRREFDHFSHLRHRQVVAYATKAVELKRYLSMQRSIVVSTQQKFDWILKEMHSDPALKNLRVAFLIDEAHRSQEGKMGVAIRKPFRRSPDDPDKDDSAGPDPEEEITRILRAHDANQLFVAFTATPSEATVQLFGVAFDCYSEAEAIQEGYIIDVADSVISYKTLYNLHCAVVPTQQQQQPLYPKAVVAKALKQVAYQDEELIQYKAEVMLRIFNEKVAHLIDGQAKAMIVATSRVAGLRYFEIIQKKLRERGNPYKVLYAFSDFVHPQTNQQVTEAQVNGLRPDEWIGDRFQESDYRLMVVANKFQTGFDQPLLAGMFLDKVVADRNAVQTVSRLNRRHDGKQSVVVVDFTNNARAILQAFHKYRGDAALDATEPDKQQCVQLYQEILHANLFVQADAQCIVRLLVNAHHAAVQQHVHALRHRFRQRLTSIHQQQDFVLLLQRFVKSYNFLSCFFTYAHEIDRFAAFAAYVGPQLIKIGSVSDLIKQVRKTHVVKAAVIGGETVTLAAGDAAAAQPKKKGVSVGGGKVVRKRVTVQEMIDEIAHKYHISQEEALCIREVTQEKMQDNKILTTVATHKEDTYYLEHAYAYEVNGLIQDAYVARGRHAQIADPKYYETGAIFDMMAITVIQHGLQQAHTQ
ncbi:MAG: DEAD/DEAH box helicase family protein [Myxococcota bacterium]